MYIIGDKLPNIIIWWQNNACFVKIQPFSLKQIKTISLPIGILHGEKGIFIWSFLQTNAIYENLYPRSLEMWVLALSRQPETDPCFGNITLI